MDLAGRMAVRFLVLPQTLQRILLVKLAKTLPQRREARGKEFRCAKEIF
jgi:hypothetical protein